MRESLSAFVVLTPLQNAEGTTMKTAILFGGIIMGMWAIYVPAVALVNMAFFPLVAVLKFD
jgi:hypothetical protein